MAILVDFSQTAISVCLTNRLDKIEQVDLFRHLILNTLRSYVQKYSGKFGHTFLCFDTGRSWRKEGYPFYKAHRAENREASEIDWDQIFQLIHQLKKEILETGVFQCLSYQSAEADDIIAVAAKYFSETLNQDTLIISTDKDFRQLQKFSRIHQFSPHPMVNKMLVEKQPQQFLLEHIIYGDKGDGIPNILSDDNTFLEKKRQVPVTAAKLELVKSYFSGQSVDSSKILESWKENFKRNQALIDFECIPEQILINVLQTLKTLVSKISKDHQEQAKGKFLRYLMQHRCTQLIKCIEEFFPQITAETNKPLINSSFSSLFFGE